MITGLKSVRALIALSNPQAAVGAKDYFRKNSNFVRQAQNKREAQAFIADFPFNLVVLDDRFPDVGGLDFLKFMRFTDGPMACARVLFGVHEAERQLVLDVRNAGADKIIKMPLTLGVLEKSVAALLADKRAFINTTGYVGPDRRIKSGPPPGRERRIAQEGVVDPKIVTRSRMLGVHED